MSGLSVWFIRKLRTTQTVEIIPDDVISCVWDSEASDSGSEVWCVPGVDGVWGAASGTCLSEPKISLIVRAASFPPWWVWGHFLEVFNYWICSFLWLPVPPRLLPSHAPSSGRALVDWLCLHPGDSSSEEESRRLCERMFLQGLLQPFSGGVPELHDGRPSAVFAVRF